MHLGGIVIRQLQGELELQDSCGAAVGGLRHVQIPPRRAGCRRPRRPGRVLDHGGVRIGLAALLLFFLAALGFLGLGRLLGLGGGFRARRLLEQDEIGPGPATAQHQHRGERGGDHHHGRLLLARRAIALEGQTLFAFRNRRRQGSFPVRLGLRRLGLFLSKQHRPARPYARAERSGALEPTPSIAPTWLTIGFSRFARAAAFAGSSLRPAAALTKVLIDFIEEYSGPGLADLSGEVWSPD